MASRIPRRSGARAASRMAPVSRRPRRTSVEAMPKSAPKTMIPARMPRPAWRRVMVAITASVATPLTLKAAVVRPITPGASSSVEMSPRSGMLSTLPAARQP